MERISDAEEDDTFDDDDVRPAPIFKRGGMSTNSNSSFTRLSMAIRRSLRLPARSSLNRISKEDDEMDWASLRKEDGEHFTANSSTLIGPSKRPSRLQEIRDNMRQNRMEKVKKIVRKADWPVRHEVRKELWRELRKTRDFDSSRAVFREQLLDLLKGGKKMLNPQFLNEDGVVVNNFDLNEHGTMKLLRLLKVIETMRPEISSAPILYPLCAVMLHYLEDADVFACIHNLLASKNYLMTSPVEWVASVHTLLALIKKHKAHAYAMLKRRVGTADEAVLVRVLRDWLSWIFNALPLPYVVRIVDCYLVEGQKFIIRAGIAIVYMWAKTMKRDSNLDELSGKSTDERVDIVKQELFHSAQQVQISTDTFIEVCIRIRNLQSSTISRLQKENEEKLRDEVNRQHSLKKSNQRSRAARQLFTDVFESNLVDKEAASEIMAHFPARLQLATPRLLFRLSNDGASFTHMWSKIDEAEQTLLLIRTTNGEVFGAYCSSSWAERNDRRERTKSKYFGTGESFVWRLDEETELPIIYNWIGNSHDHPDTCPQMFMAARDKMMVIGSGDGDAIRIDEELTHGISSSSKTFGSPPLVEGRTFDIHELEVFDVLP